MPTTMCACPTGPGGCHLATAPLTFSCPSGKEAWTEPLPHTQHMIAGNFQGNSPVQFMCLDRGQLNPSPKVPATLYLYDLDGKEIWRREQPAGSCHTSCVGIDWSGAG